MTGTGRAVTGTGRAVMGTGRVGALLTDDASWDQAGTAGGPIRKTGTGHTCGTERVPGVSEPV